MGEDFFRTHGFFETETGRRTNAYGELVTVLSAYEAREAPAAPLLASGVNSLVVYDDGARWWILHLAWLDAKTAGTPVPLDFGARPSVKVPGPAPQK